MKANSAKSQPKRRPKGTGSIKQRRSKFWGILVHNKKELALGPFATADEADRALSDHFNGIVNPAFLPTLDEYFDKLLKGTDLDDRLSSDTVNMWDGFRANYVSGSTLGNTRLDLIKHVDCQRFVNRLYRSLSSATVRRYGSILRQVFEQAKLEELLYDRMERGRVVFANPCDGLKYRPIPAAGDIQIFEDDQLVDFPQLIAEFDRFLAAVQIVLVDTGCRRGELCAMRTTTIKGEEWTIDQAMHKKGHLQPTKTGRARTIHLSGDSMWAIAQQGVESGFIWRVDGAPMKPDYLTKQFKKFRVWLEAKWAKEGKSGDVPLLMARNMRRTFITRGVESGQVKSTQMAAGHATSKMTLDVYAQGRKDPQTALVDSLSNSLGRQRIDLKKKGKGPDKGPEKRALPG